MSESSGGNFVGCFAGFLIGAIFILCVVGASVYIYDNSSSNPIQHPTSPAQQMSDEEYLRVGINDYFMSEFDNANFPKPDYDIALEDRAVNDAVKGENLWIKISGNTAEEALKTFIALDNSRYTCNQASFWLATNKRDNPGTRYAIGVYKTSYSQYNISIVLERPQPDTQELNRNGAWITIRHDPIVSNFKPGCSTWA